MDYNAIMAKIIEDLDMEWYELFEYVRFTDLMYEYGADVDCDDYYNWIGDLRMEL